MSENNYNDPKWTQDCGEDGQQVCKLHNLHCGYPYCAKGQREDAERKAAGSPIKRGTRTDREAVLVAALEQIAMYCKDHIEPGYECAMCLTESIADKALKEYRGER